MNKHESDINYAKEWEKEARSFSSQSIYNKLLSFIPNNQRILEIGCGTGHGTYLLSKKGDVLSIDNNPVLIDKAKERTLSRKEKINIIDYDILDKSNNEKVFYEFKPTIVILWLAGGSPYSRHSYVSDHDANELLENEQISPSIDAKRQAIAYLYREEIEAAALNIAVRIPSIQYINIATRGIDKSGFLEQTYQDRLFSNEFKIESIKKIPWGKTDKFKYGPLRHDGPKCIFSFMAKRS